MYDFFMKNEVKKMLNQMFILGLNGTDLKENSNLKQLLKEDLGGVIFFTKNIQSEEQFKNLTQEIKETSSIPPFLSIDQEGGRVERTENLHGGKKYLSAKFAFEKGEDFLKQQTENISNELKNYGINLNFVPCIDVNTNPNNPIIGERAFSNDTEEVIKAGRLVVETYLKNGITPCLKHFPGHGDVDVDSHKALPQINLPLEEFENLHIKPFKDVDCPMIMIAHLHCTCFDKDVIPASLSKNVVKNYLLEKLGYEGLLITDDMVMGGVSAYGAANACKMAINAGINILLYRDSDDETVRIIEELAQMAENDLELFENIKNSYLKIKNFKENMETI